MKARASAKALGAMGAPATAAALSAAPPPGTAAAATSAAAALALAAETGKAPDREEGGLRPRLGLSHEVRLEVQAPRVLGPRRQPLGRTFRGGGRRRGEGRR